MRGRHLDLGRLLPTMCFYRPPNFTFSFSFNNFILRVARFLRAHLTEYYQSNCIDVFARFIRNPFSFFEQRFVLRNESLLVLLFCRLRFVVLNAFEVPPFCRDHYSSLHFILSSLSFGYVPLGFFERKAKAS